MKIPSSILKGLVPAVPVNLSEVLTANIREKKNLSRVVQISEFANLTGPGRAVSSRDSDALRLPSESLNSHPPWRARGLDLQLPLVSMGLEHNLLPTSPTDTSHTPNLHPYETLQRKQEHLRVEGTL